ncbi:hypothetical protein GOP47_0030890, partial [Adiantum capillus-veneris]
MVLSREARPLLLCLQAFLLFLLLLPFSDHCSWCSSGPLPVHALDNIDEAL